MTRGALEAWLIRNGALGAQSLRQAIERETLAISELDRQIANLAASVNWGNEVERLINENLRVDAELEHLEQELALASQSLIEDTELLLTKVQSADACEVLRETAELFDQLSPQDFQQPIECASVSMFKSDLGRSSLAGTLQHGVEREFAACVIALADSEMSRTRLDELEKEYKALQSEITASRQLLLEHRVSSAVITNLERVEDRLWFLEDLIQPYTQIAAAESNWKLPKDILTEIRNGS